LHQHLHLQPQLPQQQAQQQAQNSLHSLVNHHCLHSPAALHTAALLLHQRCRGCCQHLQMLVP
jgi:hypothetical protein